MKHQDPQPGQQPEPPPNVPTCLNCQTVITELNRHCKTVGCGWCTSCVPNRDEGAKK